MIVEVMEAVVVVGMAAVVVLLTIFLHLLLLIAIATILATVITPVVTVTATTEVVLLAVATATETLGTKEIATTTAKEIGQEAEATNVEAGAGVTAPTIATTVVISSTEKFINQRMSTRMYGTSTSSPSRSLTHTSATSAFTCLGISFLLTLSTISLNFIFKRS